MRLIDGDALDMYECLKSYYGDAWRDAQEVIDNAPTVDAVPVKHGKWIYKGIKGRFPACECSVCGNVENADWAVLGDNVNYCPNCGAKMDLKGVEITFVNISSTIDLVNVIRCKDCKYYNGVDHYCVNDGVSVKLDDYCSWGETKDE